MATNEERKLSVLKEPDFDLNQVKGKVKLTKAVTIKAFQTIHVSGLTECDQHFKWINVIVESDPKINYEAVIPINGYTVLKPGSSRVSVGIRNISCKSITIPAKTIIARVATANVVPHSYALNVENNEQLQQMFETHTGQESFNIKEATSQKAPVVPSLAQEREKLLFGKIDLEGTKDWNDDLKHQTRELFKEYVHIFALDSLDMGHTSLVKHKIKLDNHTPFKECYRCIPPNLFEEVKNHLKEMIQVEAIRHSSSPWASAVVLVRKKDGSLHFFYRSQKA